MQTRRYGQSVLRKMVLIEKQIAGNILVNLSNLSVLFRKRVIGESLAICLPGRNWLLVSPA